MRVYARPDSPYWCYRFKLDGKTYRGPTKFKNEEKYRSEAEKEADAIRAKKLSGETDAVERRLGELAQEWYSVEGCKMADKRNNESRIRKLFGETVDPRTQKPDNRAGLSRDLYVHQLSNAILAKLKVKRMEEGNSLKTWNREASLVQTLLRYAKSVGAKLPKEIEVKELKTGETRSGRLRWFTLVEEDALIRELDPQRPIKYQPDWDRRGVWLKRGLTDQRDLVLFLIDTGGRYGEGAGVTWDVVDFGRGTINLYRDKVGNEGDLAMTKRVKEMLLRRFNERAPGNPYIFPAGITGPQGHKKEGARGYAVSGIRAAMERAGLNAPHLVARFGKATPAHTLRHTFASRLVQAGMSLQKVAYLLGHADVSTTQIYAHLVPSETANEAAAILDRLAQRGEVIDINTRRVA